MSSSAAAERPAGLEGRVALVTGASRGIGAHIADALAAAGAEVVGCDITEPIQEKSRRMLRCDVGDPDAVDGLVDQVEAEVGPIDILVNNAGILTSEALRKLSNEAVERVIRVNLLGTIWCTRAAGTRMSARGHGRVISLTSITATRGEACTSAYAASKGGIIGFTRSMAREYAHRGVTVNAIAPGYIDTDQTRDVFVGAVGASVMAQIPMRRLGTATDIAATAVFLSGDGDGAAYVTGQVLTVDGGVT